MVINVHPLFAAETVVAFGVSQHGWAWSSHAFCVVEIQTLQVQGLFSLMGLLRKEFVFQISSKSLKADCEGDLCAKVFAPCDSAQQPADVWSKRQRQ